jgi:hypothetical protein
VRGRRTWPSSAVATNGRRCCYNRPSALLQAAMLVYFVNGVLPGVGDDAAMEGGGASWELFGARCFQGSRLRGPRRRIFLQQWRRDSHSVRCGGEEESGCQEEVSWGRRLLLCRSGGLVSMCVSTFDRRKGHVSRCPCGGSKVLIPRGTLSVALSRFQPYNN